MLNLVRPARPEAPRRQEARQDSHKDAGPSPRCVVAPLPELQGVSSSTVARRVVSRQRGRSERATRQQGHHNLAWPDARVTLAAQPILHVPSQRPSRALHPAQLTAFIKASRSTRDLADVVNEYAQHFNEVHVMCAVSKLSNLTRYSLPYSSASGLDEGFLSAADGHKRGLPAPASCSYEVGALLDVLLPLAVPLLPRLTPRLLSGILSSLARMGAPQLPPSVAQQHEAAGHSDAGLRAVAAGDMSISGAPTGSSMPAMQGHGYYSAVLQLVDRSAEVLPDANADQGCHLLWAAVKLGCPSTRLMVAAAECVLGGSWGDDDSQHRLLAPHEARQQQAAVPRGVISAAHGSVPAWLRPMLLWSVAQGSAEQLRQPAVQQLLQQLLASPGRGGSLVSPACLSELPLSSLVTALYACSLIHDTQLGGDSGRCVSNDTGADASPLVPPATVDALCEEILNRALPAHVSGSGPSRSTLHQGLPAAASSSTLQPRAVSNCLLALSRLQHAHSGLLAQLLARAEQLLTLPACNQRSEVHVGALPHQALQHGHAFSGQELCNVVVSLAHLQLECPGLLRQLGRWLQVTASRLSPRDVGELLYSLAILQQQHEQRCKQQQQQQPDSQASGVMLRPVVQKLAQAAYDSLEHYTPRHLVGLLWDLKELGCPSHGISSRVASSLLQQATPAALSISMTSPATHTRSLDGHGQPGAQTLLPVCELEPDEVSRLCSVLASPGGLVLHGEARARVLDMVSDEVKEWISCMSSEELVVALEAFAQLQHPCPELLEAACERASQLSAEMSPTLLVRLTWSLARLEGPCSEAGGMAGVAARELLQQLASGPLAGAALQQLTVADLKKLCWSYAYAEVEPGWALLSHLSSALCSQASGLSPRDLGSVCWALARFEMPSAALQQLAGTALAALQAEESAVQRQQQLQQQPGSGQEQMSPATLATIVSSLAQRRALPLPLMLATLRSCVRQLPLVRASDASRLLWALSMCLPHQAARQDAWLLTAVAALVRIVASHLLIGSDADAASSSLSKGGGDSSSSLHARVSMQDAAGVGSDDAHMERSLTPVTLSLFLAACSGLEYHPGEHVLHEAARQLLPHVSMLRSQTLCQLLTAMTTLRAGEPASSGRSVVQGCASTAVSHRASAILGPCATEDVSAVRWVRPEVLGAGQQEPVMPSAASHQLLCSIREALTRRLCVEQLEVLGLSHMVRLAWALACRSDLWRSSRTDMMLLKALRAARRRAAAVAAGATLPRFKGRRRARAAAVKLVRTVVPRRVVPRLLMHAAARTLCAPPASLAQRPLLQRLQEETRLLLQAECQPRSTWRALRRRWLQARRGPQNGSGVAEQRQQQGTPSATQAAHIAALPPAARVQEQQCVQQVSDCLQRLGLSSDSHWVRLSQGDGVCIFKAWPTDLQRLSEMVRPLTGGTCKQLSAPRSQASPPITFAAYIVAARHLTCDASHQELASSTIRARMLRSKGYEVLALQADEWLGLSKVQQAQSLASCLLHACEQSATMRRPASFKPLRTRAAMNRRWQKEGRGRYETLQLSYGAFISSLPSLPSSMNLCDSADLYATYSALHAKGRRAEVHASMEQGFHYFMASTPASKGGAAAVPAPAAVTNQPGEGDVAGADKSTMAAASRMEVDDATEAAVDSKGGQTLEPVVTVSSKCVSLSMQRMASLFQLGPDMLARYVMLAIVDDDGSVAMVRMYNTIQPPQEGPEGEETPDVHEVKEDSD